MIVQDHHPFTPESSTGTQCMVFGCWGWVDDPRHVLSTRRAPAASQPQVFGLPVRKTPRAYRNRARPQAVGMKVKAGGPSRRAR